MVGVPPETPSSWCDDGMLTVVVPPGAIVEGADASLSSDTTALSASDGVCITIESARRGVTLLNTSMASGAVVIAAALCVAWDGDMSSIVEVDTLLLSVCRGSCVLNKSSTFGN